MYRLSKRFVLLTLGWLAAVPVAAQAPWEPLPSSIAGVAGPSSYPATSTPLPVYRSSAGSSQHFVQYVE